MASLAAPPDVSFALPCHNEEGNLERLLDEIAETMAGLPHRFEVVVCDDRSTDGSWGLLGRLAADRPWLRAVRHGANAGQSAALWTAIGATRAPLIVTLDGDGQNDPHDLPAFFEALKDEVDCVCGNRRARRKEGDKPIKLAISRTANAIRKSVLGDPLSDAGCCFRLFRREALDGLPYFKGMHRFLPIMMTFHGRRVAEVPIGNRNRLAGESHYGFFNRAGVIRDLLAMTWLKARVRPFAAVETLDPSADGIGPDARP